ncbi:unnamed protein product, partial [Mesorhabditis spiculigera]
MASRLETKIQDSLARGEYYEAHQIYRTIYNRENAAKKFDSVLALLERGINNMLEVKQFGSALDLAELYADTLQASKAPPTDATIAKISKIYSQLPRNSTDSERPSSEDRRTRFVSKLITWSQNVATTKRETKRGLAKLHAGLAAVLRHENSLEEARKHYMLADQPLELAEVIVDMQQLDDSPHEVDLFPALVAFQLICLRRVEVAGKFLSNYCRLHPKIVTEAQPYPLPLLNYVALLIQAIPKHNQSHFALLFEKYETQIVLEPAFRGLIDKIGQMYFGLPPPRAAGAGGLFGNMFQGLLGGGANQPKKDDSASEDEYAGGEPMDEDAATEEDKPRSANQAPSSAPPPRGSTMQDMDELD